MIGLSQAARRHAGAHVSQRAYDAAQEARAHAMAGDVLAVERSLDVAGELAALVEQHRADAPPWTYWCNPPFYALCAGLAHRYLASEHPRYAAQGIELLTSGLAGLGEERRVE